MGNEKNHLKLSETDNSTAKPRGSVLLSGFKRLGKSKSILNFHQLEGNDNNNDKKKKKRRSDEDEDDEQDDEDDDLSDSDQTSFQAIGYENAAELQQPIKVRHLPTGSTNSSRVVSGSSNRTEHGDYYQEYKQPDYMYHDDCQSGQKSPLNHEFKFGNRVGTGTGAGTGAVANFKPPPGAMFNDVSSNVSSNGSFSSLDPKSRHASGPDVNRIDDTGELNHNVDLANANSNLPHQSRKSMVNNNNETKKKRRNSGIDYLIMDRGNGAGGSGSGSAGNSTQRSSTMDSSKLASVGLNLAGYGLTEDSMPPPSSKLVKRLTESHSSAYHQNNSSKSSLDRDFDRETSMDYLKNSGTRIKSPGSTKSSYQVLNQSHPVQAFAAVASHMHKMPDADVVDQLFERLLSIRVFPGTAVKILRDQPTKRKWELLLREHETNSGFDLKTLTKQVTATIYTQRKKSIVSESDSANNTISRVATTSTIMSKITGKKSLDSSEDSNTSVEVNRKKHKLKDGTPEWFVSRIIENKLSVKDFKKLEKKLVENQISSKTGISWAQSFNEAQGETALSVVLARINKKSIKSNEEVDQEFIIVKCLKHIINCERMEVHFDRDATQVNKPHVIKSIIFSLISPRIATKKLVSELLIFLSYYKEKEFLQCILDGFENLQDLSGAFVRFQPWLSCLNASLDQFYANVDHLGSESSFNDYVLTSLLLINSIIEGTSVPKKRVILRREFEDSDISEVFEKLKRLKNVRLNEEIEKYEDFAEDDIANISTFVNTIDHSNDSELELVPLEYLYNEIKDQYSSSVLTDVDSVIHIKSIFNKLISMKANGKTVEEVDKQLYLIDLVMQQIVSGSTVGSEPNPVLNSAIQRLMDRLSTDDTARRAIMEAKELEQRVSELEEEKRQYSNVAGYGDENYILQLKIELKNSNNKLIHQQRQLDLLNEMILKLQGNLTKDSYKDTPDSISPPTDIPRRSSANPKFLGELESILQAAPKVENIDRTNEIYNVDDSQNRGELLSDKDGGISRKHALSSMRSQLGLAKLLGSATNSSKSQDGTSSQDTIFQPSNKLADGETVRVGNNEVAYHHDPEIEKDVVKQRLTSGESYDLATSSRVSSGSYSLDPRKKKSKKKRKKIVVDAKKPLPPLPPIPGYLLELQAEANANLSEEESESDEEDDDIVSDDIAVEIPDVVTVKKNIVDDQEVVDSNVLEVTNKVKRKSQTTTVKNGKSGENTPVGNEFFEDAQILDNNLDKEIQQSNNEKSTDSNTTPGVKETILAPACPAPHPPPPIPLFLNKLQPIADESPTPLPPPPPPIPAFMNIISSHKNIPTPSPLPLHFSINTPPPPPPPPLPRFMSGSITSTGSATSQLGASPPPPPPPPIPPFISRTNSEIGSTSSTPPPPPPPMPSSLVNSGTSSTVDSPDETLINDNVHNNLLENLLKNESMHNLLSIRPKSKLKQMHWDKIDNIEKTFWTDIEHNTLSDRLLERGILGEVEKVFIAKSSGMKMKKKVTENKLDEQAKVSFLPRDLAQQFGINLHMFSHLTPEEFVYQVLQCNEEILTNISVLEFFNSDVLSEINDSILRNFKPYSTDYTIPANHDKQPAKNPLELDKPDRIYLELCFNLRHYWKSRSRAILLTQTYQKDYLDLIKKIQLIDEANKNLRNSESLKNVFGIIRSVGNFMNDHAKQAMGFKLDTLSRLKFMKDEKNSINFLHYIEKIIRNDFSEFGSFVDELSSLQVIQNISIEQLDNDCKEFEKTINNVASSMERGNLSEEDTFHPDDQVLSLLKSPIERAKTKNTLLQMHWSKTIEEFLSLMEYFGEPSQDNHNRNNFFNKFVLFINEFKQAHIENIQREEEQRAYEARKQMIEDSKMNRRTKRNKPRHKSASDTIIQQDIYEKDDEMPDNDEKMDERSQDQENASIKSKDDAIDSLLEKLKSSAPSTSSSSREKRRKRRSQVLSMYSTSQENSSSTNSNPDDSIKTREYESVNTLKRRLTTRKNLSDSDQNKQKDDEVYLRAQAMLNQLRKDSIIETTEADLPHKQETIIET